MMSQDFHLVQLVEALKKINYDVIGLCKVKREKEEILQRTGYILYTKTDTRRRGSIGMLVKPKWKENIQEFEGYSDRVCTLILKFENDLFAIVQAYAPTSCAPETKMNQFYDQLLAATNETSTCTWQIVMGDFNAKIGQTTDYDDDVMGKFGFGTRNERGKRFLEFARQNQLFITNSMFQKKDDKRFTWSIHTTKN